MAERYTSRVALRVADAVDVGGLVEAAVDAGDLDSARPLGGEGRVVQAVHWGGRRQRGVVRRLDRDGQVLLRTEVDIAGDGLVRGLQRQARLLEGLARQLPGGGRRLVDLSAGAERDRSWLERLAGGGAELEDAVVVRHDRRDPVDGVAGPGWLHTHGAARLGVPDLELYGLEDSQVEAGRRALRAIHRQLLERGLEARLELPDGPPVYLVPVREAWGELPLDWPGVGQAGRERGPDLVGPRATLSILHRRRLGRYPTDLAGVRDALAAAS